MQIRSAMIDRPLQPAAALSSWHTLHQEGWMFLRYSILASQQQQQTNIYRYLSIPRLSSGIGRRGGGGDLIIY